MQNKADLDLLKNDVKEGESQTVEFKEELPPKPKNLADVVASFATSNAGKIYVYISAKGGIKSNNLDTKGGKDKFQLDLNGVEDNVRPAITPKVTWIKKGSHTIARIDVPKGNEPVYYSNHIPYVRDLSRSRPAKPEEVKELHRKYFEQQRFPSVTATEGVIKDQEERQTIVRLLSALSDAQVALSDIREHYTNPQLNQLQYDLGNSADEILSITAQPTLKRANLNANELTQIANQLSEMKDYKFYIGEQYWNEFISKGKKALQRINPLVDSIRNRLMVNEVSKSEYKTMVKVAINELKIDWESAQKSQYGNKLEKLRDSFRIYGYRFHRMANFHEADEIDDIRAKLQKLSKQLRQLCSVNGWGLSRMGFDRIQYLKPHMKNNLEIAN